MTYRNRVLVVYIIGVFMIVIDGTMVNVALPRLALEFGVESTEVEWIAVGYLLALAAVIPAAGWLGDRFGTKRIFLVSLVVFSSTSLLCGTAGSLPQLVAYRVLQGLGGGLVIPIGSTMLFRAFPMQERAKAAVGVLSVAVVAPAVGPVLGGVLVDQASWRWIFLINVPIGTAAVLLAWTWLHEERHEHPGRLDVAGLVLSSGGVALLLYALSIGPEEGWLTPATIVTGTVGVAALVALVVVETRVTEPMLLFRLLRDRLFRTINLAAALVYGGFFGMIFVLPLYLQTLRGYTATQSGLAQSPQAIGIFLVSNLVGKSLYRAVGPRRLMVFGSLATALVTCAYATAGLDTSLGYIALLSLLRGLAVGMVFVSIQTAVYATTSLADTGRATSLFNTQRQISYASGVALAATVITARLTTVGGDAAPAVDRLSAYQWGFLAVGLVMLPATVISWFIHDDDVAETRGLEPPVRAEAAPVRSG
jgi:EmrB/QacA subfamily drug resistance transporter